MSDFFQPILIQQIVDGLGRGSGYALLALGLAITFGVMHLLNFAHGELITISAYAAYFLAVSGANWYLIGLVIVLACVVGAVGTDIIAFKQVRNSSDFTMLMTSFGIVIMVRGAFSHWFELVPRNFDKAPWVFDTVAVLGLRLEIYDLVVIGITLVTLAGLSLLLQRTMFGMALRAAAEDFDAARLMGIKSDQVIRSSFALAGLLAGIGAVMLLLKRGQADPGMGIEVLLMPLLATIIGGLGSLRGAVIGGLLLGLLEVLLRGQILPSELGGLTEMFVFGLIALLFIVRPQGLITVRKAERV